MRPATEQKLTNHLSKTTSRRGPVGIANCYYWHLATNETVHFTVKPIKWCKSKGGNASSICCVQDQEGMLFVKLKIVAAPSDWRPQISHTNEQKTICDPASMQDVTLHEANSSLQKIPMACGSSCKINMALLASILQWIHQS